MLGFVKVIGHATFHIIQENGCANNIVLIQASKRSD
jgi:hypothetical protein